LCSNNTFAQLDTLEINLEKLIASDTPVVIHYNISKSLLESTTENSLKIPLQIVAKDNTNNYFIYQYKAPNTILRRVEKPVIITPTNNENWLLYFMMYKYTPHQGYRSPHLYMEIKELTSFISYNKQVYIHYHFTED
jgi:hypothetical protein